MSKGVGQGFRELWALNRLFRGNLLPRYAASYCIVPAGALSPVQGPSLAMDTIENQEGKSLGVTCSMEPQFLQSCCHQLEQLDAPFAGLEAVTLKGGGETSQAETLFPWQVSHDHCYSREIKAGRAVGVLHLSSSGKNGV